MNVNQCQNIIIISHYNEVMLNTTWKIKAGNEHVVDRIPLTHSEHQCILKAVGSRESGT